MTDKINKFLDDKGIKRGYGIMQEKTNEWIKISVLLVEFEALSQHEVIKSVCEDPFCINGEIQYQSGEFVNCDKCNKQTVL